MNNEKKPKMAPIIKIACFVFIGSIFWLSFEFFREKRVDWNHQAVQTDLQRIATRAQEYYRLGSVLNKENSFSQLTPDSLGIQCLINNDEMKKDGRFYIQSVSKDSMLIVGECNQRRRMDGALVSLHLVVKEDTTYFK